mmetsp:Transcript_24742/g.55259  ORF Transcript_24742/g.55259 Transcript_24742/m.55259 type:complete len:493 (-) Transcript_24742:94-1572(-)
MKWIVANLSFLLWLSAGAGVTAYSAAPSVSSFPSSFPSNSPSESYVPSDSPSDVPSGSPSDVPSGGPTMASEVPSADPSPSPSISIVPTFEGQSQPPSASSAPSSKPSVTASEMPSDVPSEVPSVVPSLAPSSTPSSASETISAQEKGTDTTQQAIDIGEATKKVYEDSVNGRRSLTAANAVFEVAATIIDCAELLDADPTLNVTTSLCVSVLVTITAPASSAVNPADVVSVNEAKVTSGDFAKELFAVSGIVAAVLLPPSEQPSSSPSESPSLSSAPSGSPSDTPSISPSDHPSMSPSGSPSGLPSTSPSQPPSIDCSDDPSFSLNNVKRLTCSWVAKKKTATRCMLVDKVSGLDVSYFCPFTCDPVCTTDAPTAAPTLAPTLSPSSESRCVDDPNLKYKGDSEKNCKWVGLSTLKRCKKKQSGEKLAVSCPSVCDYRCSCVNSKKKFQVKTFDGKSTCKVIRKKHCQMKAIKNKIVADFCPRKCGSCYNN